MKKKDSIGNRMKELYENRNQIYLTRKVPVIMRLDGRAFHTLTKGCVKPFDEALSITMVETAKMLLEGIQGAKCAYVQSDEISILITDFERFSTQGWFDYNVQKMVSLSAAMASVFFTSAWRLDGFFDSRVFNIPVHDVRNYFVWRQQDWTRNSLSMLAQANFSHKELQGKNSANMHDMLHGIGVNWADLEERWKNGVFITRPGSLGNVGISPQFTEQCMIDYFETILTVHWP